LKKGDVTSPSGFSFLFDVLEHCLTHLPGLLSPAEKPCRLLLNTTTNIPEKDMEKKNFTACRGTKR
jgi:hypothetical protein